MSDTSVTEEQDPQKIIAILSPADPESLKTAFTLMIDGMIEQTPDVILDWGTAVIASRRMIWPETGQELIEILMSVRGMEVGA